MYFELDKDDTDSLKRRSLFISLIFILKCFTKPQCYNLKFRKNNINCPRNNIRVSVSLTNNLSNYDDLQTFSCNFTGFCLIGLGKGAI